MSWNNVLVYKAKKNVSSVEVSCEAVRRLTRLVDQIYIIIMLFGRKLDLRLDSFKMKVAPMSCVHFQGPKSIFTSPNLHMLRRKYFKIV